LSVRRGCSHQSHRRCNNTCKNPFHDVTSVLGTRSRSHQDRASPTLFTEAKAAPELATIRAELAAQRFLLREILR
jgi:hypothetical protein